MVDKSKQAPIPERKGANEPKQRSDPPFVRGTINPPMKK